MYGCTFLDDEDEADAAMLFDVWERMSDPTCYGSTAVQHGAIIDTYLHMYARTLTNNL